MSVPNTILLHFTNLTIRGAKAKKVVPVFSHICEFERTQFSGSFDEELYIYGTSDTREYQITEAAALILPSDAASTA